MSQQSPWSQRSVARLVVVALVAVGLGGVAGAVQAEDFIVPGADPKAGPARKTGGGFEFRRKLSSVDNPYCDIKTYVLPDLPQQASSTRNKGNRSVIVVDASILKSDRSYAHFLMAHECCHHTLGHTKLLQATSTRNGVQPFFYLKPLLKNMELDADRCAVQFLKLAGDRDAIDSGRFRMSEFGELQTGAYYPSGIERASNIERAEAGD